MVTTLEAYGYDSYPYLHVARRRCLPYARVLYYVEMLDRAWIDRRVPLWVHDELDLLDEMDMEAIALVWRQEMIRRCPLAGIMDLATPLMVSRLIGRVSQ